ncbi:MAG: hypothetical protein AB1585_14195 [Thermodesulfobacteriota bacterium]
MKKRIFFSFLGVMLLLIPGALWADNQQDFSKNSPAILASLGPAHFTPLDDAAIKAIRGQADFVLVKVLGLNTFDYGNVKWTWNPLGYRYGNYGGYNWSGGTPVDDMDICFRTHDFAYDASSDPGVRYIADLTLRNNLASLTTSYDNFWGWIYLSNVGQNDIHVFGLSLVGGKVFRGWEKMPYSEYSRREAWLGVSFMILGRNILRLN